MSTVISERNPEKKSSKELDDGYGAENERTVIGYDKFIMQGPESGEATVIDLGRRKAATIVRTRTGEIFRITGVEATIGRSAKHSKIAIRDDSNRISKHHATFTVINDNVYLQDNGSTNGTFHRDNRLPPDEPSLLEPLDVFYLSNDEFFFVSAGTEQLFKEAERLGKMCVFMATSTFEWRLLVGEPLLLDRSHKWNDEVLASKRIHRENEAELVYTGGKYYIHDINSANGISVNGTRLYHGEKVELENGDTVSIANDNFTYKEISLQTEENR